MFSHGSRFTRAFFILLCAAMRPPRLLPTWAAIVCLCAVARGVAPPKKTSCRVQGGRADCSHLHLSAVPADLPGGITSLDLSHNTLTAIGAAALGRYARLTRLDVSFNSISRVEGGVCAALPSLQSLHVQHNEVHLLRREDLSSCTNLTLLNVASNRLKLQGEPFSVLQKLKYLDVSKNKLASAKLGSEPQLPGLVTLSLGHNDISALKKDDFSFLNQSSFLRVLNLSSVPLKTLEPGCFQPIARLRSVILDGSNMGTAAISKLCSELSDTSVDALSLRKMKLVTLLNTTFTGLQNTQLSFLDLSFNGLGRIEEGSFASLSRLQTLVLSDNNIKHLTKGTFRGLKSLKKLQLTRALVKSRTSATPIIDDFSFQALPNLQSLILQNTAVREITENTFTGLTSLTELDMSWSSYTSFKNITARTLVSLAGSPLTKLNLAGTAIVEINAGSFSVLRNLTTLVLDNNYIKQTLTGREFEGLAQVREIHMSNNHQTVNLSSAAFAHVPNLRILTLGKSLRSTALNLESSPFKALSDLSVLDLSNNNIANIRANLLEGLASLKVLKLQHNNLARLWKSANRGGPVLFLEGAPNLLTLQMDSNGLDEIPAEALRGLSRLRELSLAENLLNNLKDSVFDGLESLRIFNLQKNLITAVRPQVFGTPLSNLSLLDMAKNPFDCTCESILWFVNWLNSTNMSSVPALRDQYMCNTPLAYFNRSVMEFDTQSCKDMTPFQALYILTSTAVMTLIVSALLVRFHGWRIQFYWTILINRTLGFGDAKGAEGRQFEYDAYVIHASEDAGWVDRRLLPLEDAQCRFCLQDRDAVVGTPYLQSVLDNMRKSRKILFVVTESLLRDRWCRRFKAHHAYHEVIESNRDSVVLIFLQDVHDYKLSCSLLLRRGMLRPCCILEWPVHKERVPAFHQKLLKALGMTNRLQE